ncbi:Glycosyltransferase involved in cell wall bisynthesis [Sphingobium sp. AP50]|uniref:glycosyltransferase n=1 Tax=Sphingobium sp. AP50 TaxID=1884369 RepID=UPI0008CDF4A6|nr:glycosyltransferase [Sphingobium sp. AP50]SEI77898.1 Glycosyltransferase involved in cell wall bisynthesis [Sphingobium sp. AP50]
MFQVSRPAGRAFSVAVYLYRPGDGGLDRVAILLANHLLRRGVPVELWMAHRDGPAAHLIDPALPVRLVPSPGGVRRLSMIAQFPALAAMVRRHRPAILYSAGNQSNMLVAFATLGSDTRAVGRISNPIVRPGQRGAGAWARLAKFRAIARLSDLTIVMGEHDRALLAQSGDVRLLPRPTVTPAMERARAARALRAPGSPHRLLMVGRLAEQKDQATALHALTWLSHLDWRLTIVGQGPLQADLQRQCAALGIADRVDFAGYVGCPEALATLMAQADLLLQPSRWEGLCATLIEALACGAQVVATDSTPNIRPILADAAQHPATPVGDAAAFARAIERALTHPSCPVRAAAAVDDHGVDRALDRYLRAFESLADAPARARQPSPALS